MGLTAFLFDCGSLAAAIRRLIRDEIGAALAAVAGCLPYHADQDDVSNKGNGSGKGYRRESSGWLWEGLGGAGGCDPDGGASRYDLPHLSEYEKSKL